MVLQLFGERVQPELRPECQSAFVVVVEVVFIIEVVEVFFVIEVVVLVVK